MKDSFDPEKPLFIFKINIAGLSRQRAEEEIRVFIDSNKTDNANVWYLPTQKEPTDVKCIWNGYGSEDVILVTELQSYELQISEIIDEFKNVRGFDEETMSKIHMVLRNLKLKRLLNES